MKKYISLTLLPLVLLVGCGPDIRGGSSGGCKTDCQVEIQRESVDIYTSNIELMYDFGSKYGAKSNAGATNDAFSYKLEYDAGESYSGDFAVMMNESKGILKLKPLKSLANKSIDVNVKTTNLTKSESVDVYLTFNIKEDLKSGVYDIYLDENGEADISALGLTTSLYEYYAPEPEHYTDSSEAPLHPAGFKQYNLFGYDIACERALATGTFKLSEIVANSKYDVDDKNSFACYFRDKAKAKNTDFLSSIVGINFIRNEKQYHAIYDNYYDQSVEYVSVNISNTNDWDYQGSTQASVNNFYHKKSGNINSSVSDAQLLETVFFNKGLKIESKQVKLFDTLENSWKNVEMNTTSGSQLTLIDAPSNELRAFLLEKTPSGTDKIWKLNYDLSSSVIYEVEDILDTVYSEKGIVLVEDSLTGTNVVLLKESGDSMRISTNFTSYNGLMSNQDNSEVYIAGISLLGEGFYKLSINWSNLSGTTLTLDYPITSDLKTKGVYLEKIEGADPDTGEKVITEIEHDSDVPDIKMTLKGVNYSTEEAYGIYKDEIWVKLLTDNEYIRPEIYIINKTTGEFKNYTNNYYELTASFDSLQEAKDAYKKTVSSERYTVDYIRSDLKSPLVKETNPLGVVNTSAFKIVSEVETTPLALEKTVTKTSTGTVIDVINIKGNSSNIILKTEDALKEYCYNSVYDAYEPAFDISNGYSDISDVIIVNEKVYFLDEYGDLRSKTISIDNQCVLPH